MRWRAPWTRSRADAQPAAAAPTRAVVVDVATTGLDPHRDELLAIAAIAVHADWEARRLHLRIADAFGVDLRCTWPPQRPPDRDNILRHGIGIGRQRAGTPPEQALAAFAAYAGGAPLLAFHTAFDRTIVQRHAHMHGVALDAPWIDIAPLAETALPGVRARSRGEWLAALHIRCLARHDAMADALAECELLQMAWPAIARECGSWEAVARYARRAAWLPRG